MISRRRFMGLAVAGALPAALRAQDSLQADRLRDPYGVGQPRAPLTDLDNDPVVVAIERRLRCTCGCTLDIYTCRTTDFTCTFSPELHKEVMSMRAAGQEPEAILDTFVAREGEAILMAPPAEGFNVAGYIVPGLVMLTGALGLAAWVSRRKVQVASAGPGATWPGDAPPGSSDQIDATSRERLKAALDDVDA
jgi:cytochrome c-type biogenesis protein CcmH/NrfF